MLSDFHTTLILCYALVGVSTSILLIGGGWLKRWFLQAEKFNKRHGHVQLADKLKSIRQQLYATDNSALYEIVFYAWVALVHPVIWLGLVLSIPVWTVD